MEEKISGLEHVKLQSSSGLSVTDYCRQNGISSSSFYNCKSKERKHGSFVKITPEAARIELELSNGVKIKVAEEKLSLVLGVLSAS